MKGKKNPSVLLKLISYLLRYKLICFGASIAIIFTSSATLSLGYGVRKVVDNGFSEDSAVALTSSIYIFIGIAMIMALGTFSRFYLSLWLGERVSADLRSSVFKHLLTLHPSYFEENRSGEIMSRLTTDTTLVQTVIGTSAPKAVRSLLVITGGMIMLLITNIKLTTVVLMIAPFLIGPVLLFSRRIRILARRSQDVVADVGSYAGEVIQQIKTVQSYTQEQNERLRFDGHVEHAFSVAKRRVKQRGLMTATVLSSMITAIALVIWVGGNDVIAGVMSPGELAAFLFYALLVATSFSNFSQVIGEVQRATGASERLFELMSVESKINSPSDQTSAKISQASLEINDLTFHYPSRPEKSALENLNLSVPTGRSLALVGPSGSGKSTTFELLQRFYDPQKGVIKLDGIDIKNLPTQDLRQYIAVVSQQPSLFSNDVMYNIRYGRPEATDEEVIEAAKAAHAHEFIEQLPEGYSSFLGEQGVRLSGGQRQRVAIARAILKDPAILLLDEATSALDAESEFRVQKALDNLMKNRTTLIIAHRLATIRNVDQIAVMEDGQLIAIGEHHELLEKSPLYKRLAELQFQQT